MRLRLVEQRDLEAIRLLRNANREFFLHDHEVSPEQQQRWFEKLGQRPVQFYVIEQDGELVGTISVTHREGRKEIGNLIVAETFRGRGLMRRAVEQLTAEPGDYFCEVKAGNETSLALFRDAGFVPEYVRLQRVTSPA